MLDLHGKKRYFSCSSIVGRFRPTGISISDVHLSEGFMPRNTRDRRDSIIDAVMTAYLETGKPVGSSYLSEHCGLGLKPASIRAAMKELEDDGYLAQPHTSAGRVPTLKSHRYYVSRLMPDIDCSASEADMLSRLVEARLREYDADLFMNHMASALAEITDLIGVTLAPAFDTGTFERIEIVSIGGSRYLLVISLGGGFINTIHVTLDRVVARRQVEETARMLTERLGGLSVGEIRRTICERLRDVASGNRTLVEVILEKSSMIFTIAGDRAVHVAGLARALTHPDLHGDDSPRTLAELVEHRDDLARIMFEPTGEDSDVTIRIGGHGPLGTKPPLSLVAASYNFADAAGSIGIIGPARIPYPQLRALVKHAAALTVRYLESP